MMIRDYFLVVSIVCYSFFCYTSSEYVFNEEVGIFYKHHTARKTWKQASIICRNEGGLLAMPSSFVEMDIITNIVMDYFDSNQTKETMPVHTLLGFHDMFEEREFVTETGKDIQFVYNIFVSDEPNNIKEKCGSAKTEVGKLNDFFCNEASTFVCQKEQASRAITNYDDSKVSIPFIRECPLLPGYIYQWMKGSPTNWGYTNCDALRKKYFKPKLFKSVYKLHLTAKPWSKARTICEAGGGHLAIVDNEAEQKILVDMFNDPKNQVTYSKSNAAWIGFHDLFTPRDFVTVIGTSQLYYKKKIVKNSHHCGAINSKGILQTMDCKIPRRFFCEKEVMLDTFYTEDEN